MSEKRLFFLLAVSCALFWALLAGLFVGIDHFSSKGLQWAWWPVLGAGVFLLTPALIFTISGYAVGGTSGGSGEVDALQILDERYARGEIGREEYLRMWDDLRKR
jgi:putative membrane protein